VFKLRRALTGIDATVHHEGDGYALVADDDDIDAASFERLAERGSALLAADPEGARHELARALALWRGEPLGGLAVDTTLADDVSRLCDLRVSVVHARLEADLLLGRHDAAIVDLRRLTREHPLHEGFWRQLLQALARSGRVGEALERYDAARRIIVEELGSEPGPALRDLHRQLLDQDPSLLAPRVETTAARPVTPGSVAVLPFDVIGERETVEILSDGLHMDLLTELSRMPRLTVIGRHSVLGYANARVPLPEIAAQLGVAMLVTGSVQVEGRRFRLTVQLIEAAGGRQRWAESYDHELTVHSLLSVQHDLARDIATSLVQRALPRQTRTTTDMEAYRLVIEGRLQFDRKTEEGLAAAVRCFEQAALADAEYGAAWAGLADALAMSADYGYGDRATLVAGAEAALTRALTAAADPGMIHASRGLLAEAAKDAGRALAEYSMAIQEAPGHADAHSWCAWLFLVTGRTEQGLVSARRSVELNPLSAEAVSNLALAYLASGDPQEALKEARRATALSPTYTTAGYYEGLALHDLGRLEEAMTVLRPLAAVAAGELSAPWAGMGPDAALTVTLAEGDRREEAEQVLGTIAPEMFPVEAGLGHLALGRRDLAREIFASAGRLDYGPCLLLHHHFGGVWARLRDDRLHRWLLRTAARSWNVEPVSRAYAGRKTTESPPGEDDIDPPTT
jgi:TolB-like protein/Flp pilus assembly protein TadD